MSNAQVISANDLRAGHTVYRAADGAWVRDIAEAALIDDPAEAQLALLDAIGHATVIVGAYLVEVRPTPAGPEPVALRERFRARGPSIRPSKASRLQEKAQAYV